MRSIHLWALLSAVVLSGCQSTALRESTALQDNMGKAVAQMRSEQVSNPATLTGSQDQPVEGVDPEVAKLALESMRKDTPERSVKHDVLINLGAGTSNSGNQ